VTGIDTATAAIPATRRHCKVNNTISIKILCILRAMVDWSWRFEDKSEKDGREKVETADKHVHRVQDAVVCIGLTSGFWTTEG